MQANMEGQSWCSPTWDMMEHSNCDSHSQSSSYFDSAGQSSNTTLQNADYKGSDWSALPDPVTTSLQNIHGIPCGHEITPLEVSQYSPASGLVANQQSGQTTPRLNSSECSSMYHHHRQRKSPEAATSKEDDEMPRVSPYMTSASIPDLTDH